jgi:hypothetical protein
MKERDSREDPTYATDQAFCDLGRGRAHARTHKQTSLTPMRALVTAEPTHRPSLVQRSNMIHLPANAALSRARIPPLCT